MLVLEYLRRMRGWSKAELARRAGLNASDVSRITSGRLAPYPSQLLRLASALGQDPERSEDLVRELQDADDEVRSVRSLCEREQSGSTECEP